MENLESRTPVHGGPCSKTGAWNLLCQRRAREAKILIDGQYTKLYLPRKSGEKDSILGWISVSVFPFSFELVLFGFPDGHHGHHIAGLARSAPAPVSRLAVLLNPA